MPTRLIILLDANARTISYVHSREARNGHLRVSSSFQAFNLFVQQNLFMK
jgi:hypothetical protein